MESHQACQAYQATEKARFSCSAVTLFHDMASCGNGYGHLDVKYVGGYEAEHAWMHLLGHGLAGHASLVLSGLGWAC
jgi:hypothetical protein